VKKERSEESDRKVFANSWCA